MANLEGLKNGLQKTAAAAPKGIKELIEASAKELGKALPEHMRPERLVRIALTCIRLNPQLSLCTPESLLGALFTSAQLGLEPVAGLAHLVPFNNKRKINGAWQVIKEVQFVIGYKGVASLFYRHEKAVQIDWGVVHKNDDFEFEYGTNSFLKHVPARGERGEVTHYYVIAHLQGGGKPFMVMSDEECMDHGRKHSKTYDSEKGEFYSSSPWAKTPEAMCLKTVLIQLAKVLPLSVETQKAITADETTREFRSGIENALDLPSNTNWDDDEPVAGKKNPVGPAPKPVLANKPAEIDPETGEVIPENVSGGSQETLL